MSPVELLSQKLKEIEERGDVLNHYGYFQKDSVIRNRTNEGNEIVVNEKHLCQLLSIIPLIFKSSERKSIGSYSGKHIVEKLFFSKYISNGEFILVMMSLGYKHRTFKDTPNVSFYGSWVDTTEKELIYKFGEDMAIYKKVEADLVKLVGPAEGREGTTLQTTARMSEVATTSNAFKGDDSVKSRSDLIYERNTHRRQAKVHREERDDWNKRFNSLHVLTLKMMKETIKTTEDTQCIRKMMWKIYEEVPQQMRVFTRDTTGEKTHKGRSRVHRKSGDVEIDAHITPDGKYYKPWGEKDKPCYFLEFIKITPENFIIDDEGDLVPLKKY